MFVQVVCCGEAGDHHNKQAEKHVYIDNGKKSYINLIINTLCTIVESGIIHNINNLEAGFAQKNHAVQKHHKVDNGLYFLLHPEQEDLLGRDDHDIVVKHQPNISGHVPTHQENHNYESYFNKIGFDKLKPTRRQN